jgi:uncharacterized protein
MIMEKMLGNAINWFEIPSLDLARAKGFYESVFLQTMKIEPMGPDAQMAVFNYETTGVGGCLAHAAHIKPNADGVVIYLNANPSLDAALARVAQAGGKIVLPRTELPEGMGCFALFIDCEGNRIGLHAIK